MTRQKPFPKRAKTELGLRNDNPLARLMAGFTGFAVAVTLILATAIPVEAGRGACAMDIDAPIAACSQE
jgi:hypothetical protein